MVSKKSVESIPGKSRDKVAIVGWAATSRDQAPFDDTSFDIWSCNELGMAVPNKRWDAWFDLHARGPLPPHLIDTWRPWLNPHGQNPDRRKEVIDERIAWLAQQDCPAYMLEHYDDVPNSIPFPFVRVFERFGNYMTSTVAYQIALAIIAEYKEIHLYGIDMATDSEYWFQRPCVEWLLGIAQGGGITTHVPKESSLFTSPFVYAIEDAPGTTGTVNVHTVRKMLGKAMNDCEAKKIALYKAKGREELLQELNLEFKKAAGRYGLPIRFE